MLSTEKDRRIVADLYERYFGDLKRYFLCFVHDEMKAEDMVQDVFVRILGIDFLDPSSASRLMFSTARHLLIDELRHRAYSNKASRAYLNNLSLYEQEPSRRIEAANILSIVKGKISEMPEQRARVFTMFRMDGMRAKEIAQEIGISRRTVENHIYLASQEIRRLSAAF
ncbi:MAG: sigma-70 family RNA polymerase sigma factor [Prevotella sp.]